MEDQDSGFYQYKSKLHTYAQKNKLACPSYSTEIAGFSHVPRFRAAVRVAGQEFKSTETFLTVKNAERSVARLAFEALTSQRGSDVDPALLRQDIMLCKSILYEYNVKKGLCQPVYSTMPHGGPGLVYISSVKADGNNYTGQVAKSKKEAEQNAAYVAINAILENSESRGLMMKIIRSKYNSRPALNANPNSRDALNANPSPSPSPSPSPNSNVSNIVQVSTDLKAPQDGQDADTSKLLFDIGLSKSILKEYVDKKGQLDQPKYNTSNPDGGLRTVFLSCVEIENKYTGQVAKSKKEAENNAAFVAINSILDNSESKNLMLEVIKSKCRFKPTSNENIKSCTDSNANKNLDLNPNQSCTDPNANKNPDSNPNQPCTDPNARKNPELNPIQSCTELKAKKNPDSNPTQSCTDLKADEMNRQEETNLTMSHTEPITPLSENNCAANCVAGPPLVETDSQLVGPVKSKNARKRDRKKINKQLAKKSKMEQD